MSERNPEGFSDRDRARSSVSQAVTAPNSSDWIDLYISTLLHARLDLSIHHPYRVHTLSLPVPHKKKKLSGVGSSCLWLLCGAPTRISKRLPGWCLTEEHHRGLGTRCHMCWTAVPCILRLPARPRLHALHGRRRTHTGVPWEHLRLVVDLPGSRSSPWTLGTLEASSEGW